MGNRTYLSFGTCAEFEANNCLPITWLALFVTHEWMKRDGEEGEVEVFQTSPAVALPRVEAAISRLQGFPHIWSFLRPLEILRDELKYCGMEGIVELYVTGYVVDEEHADRIRQGPLAFTQMVNSLTGNESNDLSLLTTLVNEFSVTRIDSVTQIVPGEDRMFSMLGTYWGDNTREAVYPLEYFSESYWSPSR